jgi:hypothetical protein
MVYWYDDDDDDDNKTRFVGSFDEDLFRIIFTFDIWLRGSVVGTGEFIF